MTRYGELAAHNQGTDGPEPPLLFLHGLSYDHRQWEPVLRLLGDRRAVALDLPGHGGSPRRDSYHLEDVAQVVHEAVLAAGLNAPVVVGHSLGGALATTYAAAYPVSGVVNVDQVLLVGGFGRMLRAAEPVLRGPGHLSVWESLLAGMRIDLLPEAAQDLVRTATDPRQDLLLGYWDTLLTSPPDALDAYWERLLKEIHAKGARYTYVTGQEPTAAYWSWLESVIPDVEVHVVPGSGHFPHLAQPERITRLLSG